MHPQVLKLFPNKVIATTKSDTVSAIDIRTADKIVRIFSDNPNVVKMEKIGDRRYHLIATRDIDEGEEITVEYTLYNVGS